MQRVFVYGTLLSGQSNHHLLHEAKLFGKAKTALSSFRMWDFGRGWPGITHAKNDAGYCIIGEVYEVNEGQFAQLDILEGTRRPMKFRLFSRFTNFSLPRLYIFGRLCPSTRISWARVFKKDMWQTCVVFNFESLLCSWTVMNISYTSLPSDDVHFRAQLHPLFPGNMFVSLLCERLDASPPYIVSCKEVCCTSHFSLLVRSEPFLYVQRKLVTEQVE